MSNATTEPDGTNLSVQIKKTLSAGFSLQAEFTAPPGVTILFGPSGSGKTTLLHCVAGLLQPDAGRVALGDCLLFDSGQKIEIRVPGRSIGYLFQDLAIFPHLTVEQNIQYGLSRLDFESRRYRTAEISESFRIAHLLNRKPGEISGGERQRVALARSLVTHPKLLLLDEPLSALDDVVKAKIIEDLRAWNSARGIPIIYVTHDQQEVFALGERVVVLDAGRILAQGTPQQVMQAPRLETVAQLAGFENIFDARVTALRENNGTMVCSLKNSEVTIEAPLTRATPGLLVRVAIRAGDIILATQPLENLSARNQFPGKLVSLQQQGVTVIASVESGVKFEVHLTPGACEQLRLKTGQQVWLVIKTYSCHPVI
jgi:molybdate transport system ATP-binding protein